MRSEKVNVTPEYIDQKTAQSQFKLSGLSSNLSKKKNNESEAVRKSKQICQACFYDHAAIVMQAFWKRDCGICSTEMIFPNSYTDECCQACATKKNICKHCCSKID